MVTTFRKVEQKNNLKCIRELDFNFAMSSLIIIQTMVLCLVILSFLLRASKTRDIL